RSLADLYVVIDKNRGMGDIGWPALRRLPLDRAARLTGQRSLALVEHRQHTQSLVPVSPRRAACSHALDEMETFVAERFPLVDAHWLSLRSARHGQMILPMNRVRIEQQLAVLLRVIKDRHLSVADDDQLLLLVWVQPGDKNMRLHAAREREQAYGYIGNSFAKIIPS